MSRARLRIFGKVQGVSYRQCAQIRGKLLKLTGWVKNVSDGSVLAEVEGPSTNINDFIEWCKQGPTNAQVQLVEVDWLKDASAGDKNTYHTSSFEVL